MFIDDKKKYNTTNTHLINTNTFYNIDIKKDLSTLSIKQKNLKRN